MINFKDLLIYGPIVGVGGGGGGGVTIKNQNKTITENGTYTADSGYTGLGRVEVNVQGGGATVTTVGGWEGTPLPTDGQIGTVYYNNNLSPQEVVDLVGPTINPDGEAFMAYDVATSQENPDYEFIIIQTGVAPDGENIVIILDSCVDVETGDLVEREVFMSGPESVGFPFQGWNPDIVDFTFNFNVSNSATYGEKNNELSSILSSTPFVMNSGEPIQLIGEFDGTPIDLIEKKDIDIKALLDEKKLPLKINFMLETGSDKLQWKDYGSAVYTIQGDTCYILDCADSLGQLGGGPWKNEEIKKVVILEGTRFIHKNMFMECTNLTNVTIPYGVTAIGGDEFVGAFRGCTGLTSIIIPDSVTSIGNNAFRECTNLTNIIIPDSVTSIGLNSLDWTDADSITCPLSTLEQITTGTIQELNKIVITSGDSISERMFFGAHLTSITLPNTITNIGNNAFEYCANLTEIVYNGTIEQWNAITKGTDWDIGTGNYTIHCTKTYPKA